jgi:hypothetical protein
MFRDAKIGSLSQSVKADTSAFGGLDRMRHQPLIEHI